MEEQVICNKEDLMTLANSVRAAQESTRTYNVPELTTIASQIIENSESPTAVLYTSQILDEEQKQQARENISAVGQEEVDQLFEENAKQHPSLTVEQQASCKAFSDLFVDTVGRADAFLFFTDPHTVHNSNVTTLFDNYLNQIEAVYNNTPTSMCVCGGDWLNDSNTKENAAFVLGKIDGAMKKRFKYYVLIVGNHDTNYQGYEYMQSGADGEYDRDTISECMLSTAAIRNLWHRKQGASYFDVKCDSATYYVFDTGLDWYPEMDEYRWTQVDWFANALLTDKPERCAALMHIVDSSGAATPFVDAVTQIANAYNSKSSVTLNEKTYDFTAASGTVGFVLGGHKHTDMTYSSNGIPVILTTNLQVASGYPSFDLVLVDWDGAKINLIRVGLGENRVINIANTHVNNLFTYGVRTDYFDVTGKNVAEDTHTEFSVNSDEGYIRRNDPGSNTGVIYKIDKFANDGSTFTLSARFVNETEGNSASPRFFCKAFDSSGEIYTGAVNGWTYNDFYKGHFVDTDNIAFTLPSDATEFQIGFLFNSAENDTDYIRVYDISLTKN